MSLSGDAASATLLTPSIARRGTGDFQRNLSRLRAAGRRSDSLRAAADRPHRALPRPKGSATSIHLASAHEVHGVTGRYDVNRIPRTSNKSSYDTAAAARLWQVSATPVGLTVTA